VLRFAAGHVTGDAQPQGRPRGAGFCKSFVACLELHWKALRIAKNALHCRVEAREISGKANRAAAVVPSSSINYS
jgi:hypothetical protein